MLTNIAAAYRAADQFPEAIRANFDAQQAISASMANTLSECVATFGALQLNATKAALTGSFGAARGLFLTTNLPAVQILFAPPDQSVPQTKHGLRELGIYQERAKEEERKRIARELHDELGSLLTSVKAHISVAQARMRLAGLAQEPALETAIELTDDAVEAVRRIIIDLRPSVLDQLGVWAALEWLADRINAQHNLICDLHIEPDAAATEVDPERSTALYRIVQEAVTNVLHHAAASHIEIHVARLENDIRLEVSDDGKGIDTERMRVSFGIAGMRERALSVGGNLTISGSACKGTCLVVRMPLDASHGE